MSNGFADLQVQLQVCNEGQQRNSGDTCNAAYRTDTDTDYSLHGCVLHAC